MKRILILTLSLFSLLLSGCHGDDKKPDGDGGTNPSLPNLAVSLTVTPKNTSIAAGFSQAMQAEATLEDETVVNVTNHAAVNWSSSDESIATISDDGVVTALKEGEVLITALGTNEDESTVSDTAMITVTNATVTKLQVTPVSESTSVGLDKRFTATAFFSDNSSLDVSESPVVTWSSSDDNIATVTSTGLATGLSVGEAQISAKGTVEGLSFEGAATLTVSDAVVVNLDVSANNTTVPVGMTQALTATVTLSNDMTQNVTDSPAVTWTSSDPSIATVTSGLEEGNGVVTANSATGKVTITASGSTDGETFESSIELNVIDAVITKLQITPPSESTRVGEEKSFTATALYSDGVTVRDVTNEPTLTWTSSDANIATITTGQTDGTNGIATGVAKGSVVITAKAMTPEGTLLEATASLDVLDVFITELTVTPSNVNVAEGLEQQFIATAKYSDGKVEEVTYQPTINWTVDSDTDAVTISDTGLATAVIGKVGGSGIIKASTTNTVEGHPLTGQATMTVANATIEGFQVTPATESVPKGTPVQFTAVALMSNGESPVVTDNANVHWVSSNPEIVSITTDLESGNGLATTLGTGDVEITASGMIGEESFGDSVTLNVTAAAPVSMAITPKDVSVAKGISQQFEAVITYTDNSKQPAPNTIGWSATPNSVAVIDGSTGLADTIGVGSAEITASGTVNGVDLKTTANLTVTAAEVVSIDVTPSILNIPLGVTQQFEAKANMTDGTTSDITSQATWESNDPYLASVSATGVVKGELKGGPVTIKATLNGKSGANTELYVTDARLDRIEVTPNPVTVTERSTYSLSTKGYYSDGSISFVSPGWTGHDTSIATIVSGVVTGVSKGNTTTTATIDDGYGTLVTDEVDIEVTSLVVPMCGTGVDDTAPASVDAVGECLKVATDPSGNWFSGTPSIAVMNFLGYSKDSSATNSGDTYADVDGYGTFALFTQEGATAINPENGGNGTDGQFDRWCQKLSALEFGGKSNWRRPTIDELSAFYQKYEDEYYGLESARGWPAYYTAYASSTVVDDVYSAMRLNTGDVWVPSTLLEPFYASCISNL
ncbi:hypothetical protein CGK40_23000 [Vibrio parahaemolyticus]|uniref:Ig-like domain-containing protein n=1 Tax=Vibrio parahaemolyticus TaxID=670 RepID=UPI0011225789|nr:Ig-like domain-containing protein [Vibrio parahaemolyticus]TNZ87818.1 hypothetical protein CGK40_23000 [Vibrio parahaemolyticus]